MATKSTLFLNPLYITLSVLTMLTVACKKQNTNSLNDIVGEYIGNTTQFHYSYFVSSHFGASDTLYYPDTTIISKLSENSFVLKKKLRGYGYWESCEFSFNEDNKVYYGPERGQGNHIELNIGPGGRDISFTLKKDLSYDYRDTYQFSGVKQ